MSVISLLLIVAASIVLILLVVVLVAQIKSNRHIETLKERVDTSKREAKKEVRKPKVMKGAQPSAKKATGKTSPPPRLFKNGSMLGAVAGMSPF